MLNTQCYQVGITGKVTKIGNGDANLFFRHVKYNETQPLCSYPTCQLPTFLAASLERRTGREPARMAGQSAFKAVTVPALVIHGDADPLVPVEGGMDTANAIPEAKLLIIEGMGHALPPTIWSQVIEAIANHAVEA